MPGDRMTIRQLARLSGVSIGTVSRALNGYADVGPETRARIQRLAREHDYTPAAAARNLAGQRSHVVGVFLETGEGHPDLQHPFFHEVLVGLKRAIGARGYDLLLFASERPGGGYGDHSFLMRCRHHSVGGAVLMGLDPSDPEVQRLVRSNLPCIGVDVELEGPAASYVTSDNEQGAALAVRHLHGLGHRRIATIAGAPDTRPGGERLRGYHRELAELGLGARREYEVAGDFYLESGRQAATRLLGLAERPTAIFAASDMMALGVLRAAAELGLEIPRDVSLVGFDDMQLAAHVHPPLTTLRQDKLRLGAEAGGGLLTRIESGEQGPAVVTLPVELVVRSSTAPPAGS